MSRLYAATLVALAIAALPACGTEDGSVADDPEPSTSASPTEEPTAEPTVGTYPPFTPESYTYRLSVTCFCMGAGVPIKVTVDDGDVVKAVYVADDDGRSAVQKGDPADKAFWLTINDIIDAANDTSAARVDVVWPPGQDHPTSVFVDKDELTVDEEVGYTISAVRVR